MIDGRIGDGIVELFVFMSVMLLIFVPLGIWKLIEIMIWIFNHVEVGIR